MTYTCTCTRRFFFSPRSSSSCLRMAGEIQPASRPVRSPPPELHRASPTFRPGRPQLRPLNSIGPRPRSAPAGRSSIPCSGPGTRLSVSRAGTPRSSPRAPDLRIDASEASRGYHIGQFCASSAPCMHHAGCSVGREPVTAPRCQRRVRRQPLPRPCRRPCHCSDRDLATASRPRCPYFSDRKSTRLNSSHITRSRMPSSA